MAAAETEADSSAIRALGSLFTISQVSLWDYAEGSDFEVSDPVVDFEEYEKEESMISKVTADVNISVKQPIDAEDCSSKEDFELAHHMAALGLPLSFGTSKQRQVASSGQKKRMRVKSKFASKDKEPGVSIIEQNKYSHPDISVDSTHLAVSVGSAEGECVATTSCALEENHSISVQDISVDSTHLAVSVGSAEGEYVATTSCALEENHSISVQFDSCFAPDTSLSVRGDAEIEISDEIIYLEDAEKGLHTSTVDMAAENLGQNESLDAGSFSQEMCSGCYAVLPTKQDYDNTSVYGELGDWRVIWDNYYRRNYFYNYKTEETTWYTPQGLENLTCSCSLSTPNSLSADEVEQYSGFQFNCGAEDTKIMQTPSDPLQENINVINLISSESSAKTNYDDCLGKKSGFDSLDLMIIHEEASDNLISHHPALTDIIDGMENAISQDKQEDTITDNEAQTMSDAPGVTIDDGLITFSNEGGCHGVGVEDSMKDELDNNHEVAVVKRKQRRQRQKSELKWLGVLDLSADIFKYWCQRYSLFSRYDSGIKMDKEGWFSVTPEAIARHHATRTSGGVVIDCFTGVGGNAIQFAIKSSHVIAIDIDPKKVELAYNNSTIYGVNHKIDFIQGDFFKMATHLKGDTVFLSPPWGGPDYAKVQTYDIRLMLKPYDGYFLFKTASTIASQVVMFLPRNVDFNQLAELSLSVHPPWAVEVEKNILNGKFKAVTAYFRRTT